MYYFEQICEATAKIKTATVWPLNDLPHLENHPTKMNKTCRELLEKLIKVELKSATLVRGAPKAPFSIATTPRCREGATPFPGLLCFTLDPYLMMLSVKQGDIKYHFLSFWYDSTWD